MLRAKYHTGGIDKFIEFENEEEALKYFDECGADIYWVESGKIRYYVPDTNTYYEILEDNGKEEK